MKYPSNSYQVIESVNTKNDISSIEYEVVEPEGGQGKGRGRGGKGKHGKN